MTNLTVLLNINSTHTYAQTTTHVDGFMIKREKSHDRKVTGISFNMATSLLASSSLSGTVYIYQIGGGSGTGCASSLIGPILTLKSTNTSPCNCLCLHPTDQKVAVGLWNSTIEVFELQNGKRVGKMRHSKLRLSVGVSPAAFLSLLR